MELQLKMENEERIENERKEKEEERLREEQIRTERGAALKPDTSLNQAEVDISNYEAADQDSDENDGFGKFVQHQVEVTNQT